jgi:hypothetical protein
MLFKKRTGCAFVVSGRSPRASSVSFAALWKLFTLARARGAINQPTGLPAGDLLMISAAQTKKPLTHIHDNQNNINLHARRRGCERAAFISLAGTWALKSLWETRPLLCFLAQTKFKTHAQILVISTLRFANWFSAVCISFWVTALAPIAFIFMLFAARKCSPHDLCIASFACMQIYMRGFQ